MRNIRQLLVAFLMSAVVACGGGGTLGESGTPGTPSYTIALALTDANGAASKDLSKANPLKIKATVTATNGSAANKLITFTINDSDLASFNNGAGTAQTLADGTAEIGLLAGTKSGAGEISASIDGGTPVRIAFTSAGDGGSGLFVITLDVLSANGGTAAEVSKNNPLIVTATLKSISGVPQPGKLIRFKLDNAELANFNNDAGTAETNSNGTATIGLNAGTKSGAGVITATLDGNTETVATKTFSSRGDGGTVDTTPVGSILLYADKVQLGAGSADRVELSALVRDKNNVLMKNVKVQFSADNDSELEVVSDVTGNDGVAKANLSSKTNFSIRTVKVTATAGSENKNSTVSVNVIGTRLDVLGPTAVVLSGNTELTLSLQDSAGNGIKDTVIELTSSLKNSFNIVNPKTDAATGRAVVTYTAVNLGTDVITAKALGVTTTYSLVVNPDSFKFEPEPAGMPEIPEIELNSRKTLTVNWLRNNLPNPNSEVLFSTTRGEITGNGQDFSGQVVTSMQTDAGGLAKVDVRAEYAGIATIAASSKTGNTDISTAKLVEFVSKNPEVVEVQVFPSQIGVGEKATVTAVVRDTKDNPVKNQVVAFSLSNSASGQLSPATAKTNSQGVATTEFIADANTAGSGTPGNTSGLRINATIDAGKDKPKVEGFTGVSVGRRTLFFRFGSGNVVTKVDPNLYSVPYAIIVTDASGNPVPNQQLNVAITPSRYVKGGQFRNPLFGAFVSWVATPSISCASEDLDRDGILDAGEDVNGDRQLTPGNIATAPRTVTANSDGIAQFNITYPREYANWVLVDVTVSSTAAGTENVSSRALGLPIAGSDAVTESAPPADSPFGIGFNAIIDDRTAFDTTRPATCSDLR